MIDFHIAMVGLFKPFLDDLNKKGVNTDSLINECGLDNYDLSENGNYVPTSLMYSLFQKVQEKEGIDDYVDEFSDLFKVQSLEQFGETITYTTDLHSALLNAEKNNELVISNEKAWLSIDGPKATMHFKLNDNPSIGKNKMEQISLSILINGVRIAAGPDWCPDEIHFQQNNAFNLDAILPSGCNTKIRFNQPEMAFVFPTEDLTLPMLGASGFEIEKIPELDLSLKWKIYKLLDSFNGQTIPNLYIFSEMAEVSVSTFKRKLALEDTTFQETLDNWRFKTAITNLKKSNLKVKEISERLGYSNDSNFVRAFTRWTNTSPNQYRELL